MNTKTDTRDSSFYSGFKKKRIAYHDNDSDNNNSDSKKYDMKDRYKKNNKKQDNDKKNSFKKFSDAKKSNWKKDDRGQDKGGQGSKDKHFSNRREERKDRRNDSEVKMSNKFDMESIKKEKNADKNFDELESGDINLRYGFVAKIEEIKQTSGPTIFTLNDGSSTIKSTAFVSPGKRSYPELEAGDIISLNGTVSEREGTLEISLDRAEKVSENDKEQFEKKIDALIEAKAQPIDRPFLVDSEILRKLRPEMLKIAKDIKKTILENRPIVLRHHADCDGYAGAYALERAILPLIEKQHGDESAQWHYFKRSPSKAPFYDFVDVVKDLSFALGDMSKFGQKAPLILMVDNGSTEEDLLSIRKLKIYDIDVSVVDHHYPGEVKDGRVEVDDYVKHHVNPYKVGGDSNLCAGILGTELARLINDDMDFLKYIPALAATGDRSHGEDIDKYFAMAEKMGFSREYLQDLAEVVDFEAHYIRFMESRILVSDLLGKDLEKQKNLVKLLIEDIRTKKEQMLEVTKHYAQLKEVNGKLIMKLDATKVTSRGEYPAVGKAVGMTHDHFMNEKQKPIISFGVGPDFMTIRVSDGVDININDLIKELQQKLPYASIDGGGHEHAGTIKFVEAAKDEVEKAVFERLDRI